MSGRPGPGVGAGLGFDAAIAVLLGAARPGTPVPDLETLARLAGLRTIEAAEGLDVLLQRHAVELVPGSGRLVTRRIPYRIDARVHASLTDGVQRSGSIRPGMEFRSLVRSLQRQAASADVAERLQIPLGAPVLRLHRERTLGHEVIGAGTSWLPVDATGETDETDETGPADRVDGGTSAFTDRLFRHASLAAVIERYHGGELHRLSYRVELDHPPDAVAVLFGPARDELAWWVESINTTRSAAGAAGAGGASAQPMELSRGWLRADVFRLLLEHPASSSP